MSIERRISLDDPLMRNGIISPKWQSFHDALSGILKVTIAVVGADGRLLAVHNARPPFSEFTDNPALRTGYKEFFERLSDYYQSAGTDHILIDPLGLPVGAIPIGEGNFLLLGGCLDGNDPQRLQELKVKLNSLKIDDENQVWLKMILLSRDELRDNLAQVEILYSQMIRSLDENTELGQQMLLLSCVEEINKLMVATLNLESFNLPAILDLVASSLVILSDGKGALAFTYRRPSRSTVVFQGESTALMEMLRDRWEGITGGDEDPASIFPGIVRDLVTANLEIPIEMNTYQDTDSSALLAVIEPQSKNLQSILASLSKQVAIALRVSSLYEVLHSRFATLLNSINHGIIVTDHAANAGLINKPALNILQSVCIMLSHGEPLPGCGICPRMVEAVEKVIETGCSITQKRSTVGNSKKTVHLRWDVMPLVGEDGILTGSIIIFEDITEPVNLFREIQDWERLATAGEVAAGLAHEIRNPLATAMAAIQLFELSNDQAKRKELMGKLGQELERMNQILTSFLSVSKPVSKETQQQLDIVGILNEMEYLLRCEAHLNEIELVITQPSGRLSTVTGCANDIKQVFLNIARNAIEAMARGGRLIISVSEKAGRITVSFKDNGLGISPENLVNITRPFFTTKLGGTGLGLSISSSIVKMMDGHISIDSRLGQGTKVKIILPVNQGQPG